MSATRTLDSPSQHKVMKGLPNTCHTYRTEGFQIPIKPFLFENLDLIGNPVVTLVPTLPFDVCYTDASYPDWINDNNLFYSCLRDWRLSALWGTNWGPPETRRTSQHHCIEEFKLRIEELYWGFSSPPKLCRETRNSRTFNVICDTLLVWLVQQFIII